MSLKLETCNSGGILSQIYDAFDYRTHSLLKLLVEEGPTQLLEQTIEAGFEANEDGYASKCHQLAWVDDDVHEADVSPENILAMREAVREFGGTYEI